MIMLPNDSHLLIEQIHLDETITITLRSALSTAACSSCGSMAEHIHSRYRRTLTDLLPVPALAFVIVPLMT